MKSLSTYYNEHDPFAAAWLRALIAAGHLPAGDVDERSIADVCATDLVGYSQVHLFAGIGGWPLALRLAGIPDDAPVWTGSCPCQPFSVAGKGRGTADERHLWPEMRRLVEERRPAIVLGEQVAGRAGLDWLSAVRIDLEGLGYAVGAADLCAAGVGAPHLRQRLYWGAVADSMHTGWASWRAEPGDGQTAGGGGDGGMADSNHQRCDGEHSLLLPGGRGAQAARGGGDGGMADTGRGGHERRPTVGGERSAPGPDAGAAPQREWGGAYACGGRPGSRVADADDARLEGWRGGRDGAAERAARPSGVGSQGPRGNHGLADAMRDGWQQGRRDGAGSVSPPDGRPPDIRLDGGPSRGPRAYHGGWAASDWLGCRDGKWRPVEPGTFPLVDGIPARVGRLRGYGNAIVPQVAAHFVEALLKL